MNYAHIFTTNKQPATSFTDNCGSTPLTGGWKPSVMLWTDCCDKKRKAGSCEVQCFYDGLRVWCADGKGCKNPHMIAKKRRAQHMNRSVAQQARRAREAIFMCAN